MKKDPIITRPVQLL